MPMPRRDLTGQRFGRLTAIKYHDSEAAKLQQENKTAV